MPHRERAVAVAAVALAALAWWAVRDHRGGAGGAPVAAERLVVDEPRRPASPGLAAAFATPAAAPITGRVEEVLAQYRRDAVYPPWSRPLDEGARYKLAWNEAIVSELPFAEDAAGGKLLYRFAADRHHVTFGAALTSWIEVWPAAAPARRVPLRVRSAWVIATSGAAQGRAVALEYRDDGRDGDAVAGDLRYTNRLVPSAHDELRESRQVHILADVEVARLGVARPMLRDFTYAARPVLEVHALHDAVRDGSLVVTVDCEVFEPGLYTFEANLTTVDGETPLAYLDQSFPLEVGRQRVELTFFGRAIRDQGLSGPYLVRDLRGFERFLDGSQANLWWSHPAPHQTAPYAVTDFSAAEWNAPEKHDKLLRLEALRGTRSTPVTP